MIDILVLGVIISIVFYEITDLSPGGIIVPGLLVMYISTPLRMLYTLAVALGSYYLVKLLSRTFIIFGKRRFVLYVVVSLVLHFLFNLVFGLFTQDFSGTTVAIVGYTVSGIIANTCNKQGVLKTTLSLGVVVGILELVILALSAAGVIV